MAWRDIARHRVRSFFSALRIIRPLLRHQKRQRYRMIVARCVLTGEIKYFLANRVPGADSWSLRKLLRVAFSRWVIEDCFREAKED